MTEEATTLIDLTVHKLKTAHNIVLHGAPGTGKTYLARQVAAKMMGWDGSSDNLESFLKEHHNQYGFVQFHPSYDYTDFVEGLRPVSKETGEIGFELRPGVFKEFTSRAQRSQQFDEAWDYFSDLSQEELKTLNLWKVKNKNKEYEHTCFGADGLPKSCIPHDQMQALVLEGKQPLRDNGKPIEPPLLNFFHSFAAEIEQRMKEQSGVSQASNSDDVSTAGTQATRPYVFIIDEVNRGDISKIFGELFFSIDPGYRGGVGKVQTQYASMHDEDEEAFYVPENVYIICTMNDIDRSVESFDFAMRRRFHFIEIEPTDTQYMLGDDPKSIIINRMNNLNKKICEESALGNAYQIGASYFLRNTTDELWADQLEPLIREYLRGTYSENSELNRKLKEYEDAFYDKTKE